MKPRLIVALLCFGLALVVLTARYATPQTRLQALGDPASQLLLTGFSPVERLGGQLVRRTETGGVIQIPLSDGRGVLSVTLWLRSERHGRIVLATGGQQLPLQARAELRHYTLLHPGQATRTADISVTPRTGSAVAVAQVTAAGRDGFPAALDLAALLLIAAMPAVLMVLTACLPLDWAVLPSVLAVVLIGLLPAADRAAWLASGPWATLAVGGVAALPWFRARPTLALIVLGGAALRWYALGWGTGHVFHPQEQQLAAGVGVFAWPGQAIALLLHMMTGDSGWRDGWHAVLIGRAWSAALGTALLVVVSGLGSVLLRPRWALLATAFAACAPVLVQHSHLAVQSQLATLLVAVLVLYSTLITTCTYQRAAVWAAITGLALLCVSPLGVVWLAAPLVALVMVLHAKRSVMLATAMLVTLLLALLATQLRDGVALAADAASAGADSWPPRVPYVYPLFNILLWGVGPVLMQLGVVGWGVAAVRACQLQRERRWLPLLVSSALAFSVAGRGPQFSLDMLLPLVPLLSLTATLLLQTYSQRLGFRFGQRTLRLLAGTALSLALAASIGLLNLYGAPHSHVAASRWLIEHVEADDVLRADDQLHGLLPLGAADAFRAVPLHHAAATPADLHEYAGMIAETDYFVTSLEREDLVRLPELLPGQPRMAECMYAALLDGRLGFVKRASFAAQPHIGSWTIDDRRADPALRVYDHPRLFVYKKIVTPSSATIQQLLRC